jgi:hypothetical protein
MANIFSYFIDSVQTQPSEWLMFIELPNSLKFTKARKHLTYFIFLMLVVFVRYPLTVRQEVFQKVERQYMLGLRAKDPEMRKNFFALYHESLGKTLFTRLQYIIQTQEWEALSDVFWIKQGLDLLLATSIEHEPINLLHIQHRCLL